MAERKAALNGLQVIRHQHVEALLSFPHSLPAKFDLLTQAINWSDGPAILAIMRHMTSSLSDRVLFRELKATKFRIAVNTWVKYLKRVRNFDQAADL